MMRFFWIILNLPESFTTNLNPWKKCDQFDLMELIATNPNRKIILFATNLNLSESVATILNPCKNVRPIWTHNYICDQIRTVKWYFLRPNWTSLDYLRPIRTHGKNCDQFDPTINIFTTNSNLLNILWPFRPCAQIINDQSDIAKEITTNSSIHGIFLATNPNPELEFATN